MSLDHFMIIRQKIALLTYFLTLISTPNYLRKFQVSHPSTHFIVYTMFFQATQHQLPYQRPNKCRHSCLLKPFVYHSCIYGITTPERRIMQALFNSTYHNTQKRCPSPCHYLILILYTEYSFVLLII